MKEVVISFIVKNKKKITLLVFCICIFLSTFSQSQISNIPRLKIWLRADSGVVINSGKITDWIDVSGNNYVFTQSSVSMQPTQLISATLNNKPYVYFDGSCKLQSTTNFSFSDCSIFCVSSQNTLDNQYGRLIDHDFTNGFWLGRTDLLNKFGGGFIEPNDPYGNYENVTNDVPFISSTFRQGSVVFNYLNQIPFSTPSRTTTSAPTATNPISIGASLNNVNFGNKNIYEILIFDTIVSPSEKIIIEKYLNDKYAPPITLPPDLTLANTFCDSTIIPNGYFASYQWSTGATTPNISINKSGKYWVKGTNIFGINSSDTIYVTFPIVNLLAGDTVFCSGNNVVWNTNLSNNLFSFQWQDNSTDSLLSINQAGNYYLKITDLFGCNITSDTLKITVDNFSTTTSLGNDTTLCSGNSIALTSGNSPSLTYTWSTGSNNNEIVISTAGQYSVVITNTNNCIARDSINVSISGLAPTSNFTTSIGCINNAVSFTDLSIPPSSNTISNYEWNFGDNLSSTNTSTLSNPTHTYTNTGIYNIQLKVITNVGCEQTITKSLTIAPTPSVNFSIGISCKNDSTAFTNLSSSTSGYSITNFSWNFGDPSSGLANNSNNQNPKHVFNTQTTYSIVLTATNNAGCTSSITSNVIVKAEVSASFTNTPPCKGSTTTFQDNSIAPFGSNRFWDFGTNTAVGTLATKTYTNSGVYSVTLTVTGTNGCISKTEKQIIVYLPPISSFSLSNLCLKDTISISNSSISQSGILSSFKWKLNNSSFSAIQTPTITSAITGTFAMNLVVTNSFGCKDSSLTKTLTVLPLPIVDFTTNPISNYYINSAITFSPSINNASIYNWNFGGISTSSLSVPTTTFVNEGNYSVSLNLVDQNGCKNSKTKTLTVSKRIVDVAILNVTTIKDATGFMTVESDIANFGSVPVNQLDMYYQISDGGSIKETWNGNLNPNTFYTYTFTAKSASQNTTENNITCVDIEKANGILDENLSNNKLCNSLYTGDISVSNPVPNPTEGDIILPIILNADMDFTITIYNLLGQIQYAETLQKGLTGLNFVALPTSSYTRGGYIIKIMIGEKRFIQKFIKIENK